MPDFGGARVALLEARLAEETADMVRRLGGEPIGAPAVREVARTTPGLIDDLIVRLANAREPLLICLTGAGVRALLAQAADQGCEAALLRAIGRTTTVCRGPKPAGALGVRGLPVSIRAAAPFTTREVREAMAGLPLEGRFAAVVHYGERNAVLADWLRGRGAELCELMPYEWRMPADSAPLERLVESLIAGRVDAVAFTSQIQVRHLWAAAGPARAGALQHALNGRTVTGAIGPTCAAALETAGVRPAVVASPPKLNALLLALARTIEDARRGRG